MTAARPVVFTVSSTRQVEAAANWWVRNRPYAPRVFGEDLGRALSLIREQPLSGVPLGNPRLTEVRRVHLPRIRYRLYYRVDDQARRVEILAFWHDSRGGEPVLP